MSDEYLSFERVMRELKIQEDELKKLVSAGELRAFRDADQMKFKQEDVEKFINVKDGSGGDVIDLLDTDQELDAGKDAKPDAAGEELTEELVFDDVELGEDVGMKTEPLSGDDLFEEEELPADAEASDADLVIGEEEEELLGDDDDVSALRTPVKRAKAAVEEEEAENPALLGVMVVTAIVLLLSVLVVFDIATSEPSPMIEWLVGIFKP